MKNPAKSEMLRKYILKNCLFKDQIHFASIFTIFIFYPEILGVERYDLYISKNKKFESQK